MSPGRACILDYGSGNVRSVTNLVEALGFPVVVSNSPEEIAAATHLILPGVGSFGRSMEKIRATIPLGLVEKRVTDNTPFLGICVGMQVLATFGTEFGQNKGLNWVPGRVDKLNSGERSLPHVGWNDLLIQRPGWLLDGLADCPDFYFVHSYAMQPQDESVVLAQATYGESFVAAIQRENLCGVQFHPEKSQTAGRRVMANFLGRLN